MHSRPPTGSHHRRFAVRDTRKADPCQQHRRSQGEVAMRAGSAFRRCTRDGCRANVAASVRACPKCGGHSLSWAFVIDLALPGSKRKQRFGSGFATKAAALEAMNRLQAAVVDGTHVERSRRTLAAYLEDWLAARSDIRANTAPRYNGCIPNHIRPRPGGVTRQGAG